MLGRSWRLLCERPALRAHRAGSPRGCTDLVASLLGGLLHRRREDEQAPGGPPEYDGIRSAWGHVTQLSKPHGPPALTENLPHGNPPGCIGHREAGRHPGDSHHEAQGGDRRPSLPGIPPRSPGRQARPAVNGGAPSSRAPQWKANGGTHWSRTMGAFFRRPIGGHVAGRRHGSPRGEKRAGQCWVWEV